MSLGNRPSEPRCMCSEPGIVMPRNFRTTESPGIRPGSKLTKLFLMETLKEIPEIWSVFSSRRQVLATTRTKSS